MRVLLKDAQTGLYYQNEGAWVREPESAMHFDTVESAGKAAVLKAEADLDVLLRYENPVQEVALNPAYCVPWQALKSLQQRGMASCSA